jgi:ABC-type uncharacterized transport system substrate-binding protein
MKYLLLLFAIVNYCFAHPHTFIEVYPTIEIKNNITTKIHFKWELDEMTSSMLIMEFDQNGDGKIDKKENFFIYASYFTSLKDYHFYTYLKVNNKIQSIPKPKNFKSKIENNKICYSFDIKEKYNAKNLKFDFGDETFFVAMILKDKFIKLKGAKYKISELDTNSYFGYQLKIKGK